VLLTYGLKFTLASRGFPATAWLLLVLLTKMCRMTPEEST